jgi:pilus assembly protein CpaE
VKIAAVSKNQQLLEELRRILISEMVMIEVSITVGTILQAEAVAEQNRSDILIIEATCDNLAELASLEHISLRHPAMAIILLCPVRSPEFLIEAMRVGVREVISLPLSKPALMEAVARVQQRAAVVKPLQKGTVLAFIGCKGGSGATFLATNLGYILAAAKGKKVALLDLNLQFGDASLFVSDNIPANTLADVAGSNASRLDAYFLASAMVQILPNFGVLAAPEDPSRATEVKPEAIEVLLNLAKTHYDFVILDVGRSLNAVSVKALDHADLIFTVIQQTLPFIRDANRELHSLQALGYPRDKVRLILNRCEDVGDIRLGDVERTLGVKVFKTIPNSYLAVSASVNQGVPMMQISAHDPVTKALQAIAQELVGEESVKRSGWLHNLLHAA